MLLAGQKCCCIVQFGFGRARSVIATCNKCSGAPERFSQPCNRCSGVPEAKLQGATDVRARPNAFFLVVSTFVHMLCFRFAKAFGGSFHPHAVAHLLLSLNNYYVFSRQSSSNLHVISYTLPNSYIGFASHSFYNGPHEGAIVEIDLDDVGGQHDGRGGCSGLHFGL